MKIKNKISLIHIYIYIYVSILYYYNNLKKKVWKLRVLQINR